MTGVLKGIRIIDWTQWQMGPAATVMMAELGAEVIHIESPHSGDHGRHFKSMTCPEKVDGRNVYFEVNNHGKKSLTINLAKPEGREIMYRLAKKSDVFIHNFRNGVPDRLGLDYETISRYNPMIVYVAASGFGNKGPEAFEPAFDLAALAKSGISSLFSSGDNPNLPLFGAIADQTGAMIGAQAILTGLLARERLGIGQKIDFSLLSGMLCLQALYIGMTWMALPGADKPYYGEKPTRANAPNPLWNYYKCKDGRWICLGNLQPDLKWHFLCKALGIEHLEKDPRWVNQIVRTQNSAGIIAIMDKVFLTRTLDEWMKLLKETGDIVCTPVQILEDLVRDPQVLENNYLVEVEHEAIGKVKMRNYPFEMSKTPAKIKAEAPQLGQHTEDILTELLDYSWDEVGEMKESGII